jgi:hypothetical protein
MTLLRAATVWSNLFHPSRTPFALKRYSTWANHPAALSAQHGGSVMKTEVHSGGKFACTYVTNRSDAFPGLLNVEWNVRKS